MYIPHILVFLPFLSAILSGFLIFAKNEMTKIGLQGHKILYPYKRNYNKMGGVDLISIKISFIMAFLKYQCIIPKGELALSKSQSSSLFDRLRDPCFRWVINPIDDRLIIYRFLISLRCIRNDICCCGLGEKSAALPHFSPLKKQINCHPERSEGSLSI